MKTKTVLFVLAALGAWYVMNKAQKEAAVLTKANAAPPVTAAGAGATYPRGVFRV